MTENEFIEERLLQCAAPLPPHLKHRVLDACASKAARQKQRNRRANWRLAWGFAVVAAIHFGVGGALNAQQNALVGTSGSATSTRYAQETEQRNVQASLVLRSKLLAELTDPRRRSF